MSASQSPKKGTTGVAIVLDKSGSMGIARKETVEALNAQIRTIKEKSKGTKVTLVQFNHELLAGPIDKAPKEIKQFDMEDYRPDGLTALYDGVDYAIRLLEDAPAKEAYLVVIISDGQENSSKNINRKDLAEKIQMLQSKGNWSFSYIGAVKDLTEISKELNIPVGNISYMDISSVAGRVDGMTRTRNATATYFNSRAGGQTVTCNFYNPSDED